jgi:RibD C-terminal domain
VHGSGALIRSLLEQDLVDEVNLFTCPVVVGQGTRLFPERGPDRAFELTGSQVTPNGVIIQVYRPTGHLEYGTSTADLEHVGWAAVAPTLAGGLYSDRRRRCSTSVQAIRTTSISATGPK